MSTTLLNLFKLCPIPKIVYVRIIKYHQYHPPAFALALFVRDRDARCIGFTNKICAAICDPCRQFIPGGDDVVDTPVDVFDVVESLSNA